MPYIASHPRQDGLDFFFLLYEYPSIALADMYNKYLGSWRASQHGREGRVAAGRLRDEYSN